MATPLGLTTWKQPKSGGTSFSVSLPRTAVAGNTIIFASAGGAISTPSGFTRSDAGYGGGAQDVSIWHKIAVGGETSVSVSLNGSGDNVGGFVRMYTETLTRVNGSNNGSGASPQQSASYAVAPNAITPTAAHSLGIAIWSASQATAYSAANRFRQCGPFGTILVNDAEQDASGSTKVIYQGAEFDLYSTKSFPATNSAGTYAPTATYQLATTCFASCAYFTDTSGVTTVASSGNNIVDENTLPGADNSIWYLNTAGTNATIAGYCDQCSYSPGDTVNFKVDSTSHTFSVTVFRLGFYGYDNFSARQVSPAITGTVTTQSAASVDSTLGSSSCSWTTNATWSVPTDAVPGYYYWIARRTDVGGTTNASSGHFIVKGSTATSKMCVISPDIGSHQPYNVWGATTDNGVLGSGTYTGRSLYQAGSDGASPNFAHRAYSVNFNRPYATQSMQVPTYIFDSEFGLIVFLEAMGYPLTYFSDVDLENNTTLLNSALMVIMPGHHEYMSTNIYDCYLNAKAAGVNFFIASSNTAGWRVRFATGDTTKRNIICYKDSGTRDVSAGFTGTGYDPVSPTGTWRDALATNSVANPDKRLDNAFTGQRFVASGPVQQQMTFADTYKSKPIWRNSSGVQALTSGTHITDISNSIGYEVDSADGATGQPTNLTIVASTSLSITTGSNANGTVYATSTTISATWTLYRDSSGALVFNVGNWRGCWSAARWQGSTRTSSVSTDVQNALNAILYDLGGTPGTVSNVLQQGVDTALTNPSVGAPTRGNSTVATAYGLTAASNAAGAATLSIVSSLTSSAAEIVAAAASLPMATNITTGIFATRLAAATLAITTTVVSGAAEIVAALANISILTTVAANAARVVPAAMTANITTAINAAAQEILPVGSSLAILTNIVTQGATTALSAATLPITTSITDNAIISRPGAASLPIITTLDVDGSVEKFSGASLNISTALMSSVDVDQAAVVTLALLTTLTASALNVAGAVTTLPVVTGVTANGIPERAGSATLDIVTDVTSDTEKLTFAQALLAAAVSIIASNTPLAAADLAIDTEISALLDITAPVAAHLMTETTMQVQGLAGMFASAMLGIDTEFQGDGVIVPPSGVQSLLQVVTHMQANEVQEAFTAASLHVLSEITANATVIGQVIINQQITWILNDTRWRFSDVMRRISQLSREFITATAYEDTYEDLTGNGVQFAFPVKDTTPIEDDWENGVWMTEGVNIAAILVGPTALALSPGRYDVWIRVVDNMERPVRDIGQLTIY